MQVRIHIHDQVAVTTVEEEFYNPSPVRLEGTFIFPVPKGAHLDKFSMEIDGRQVPAELLKADQARHIYEDIVRRLRDPALLEYAGRDVFKARIFPIEPHGTKRVSLSYTQLLPADNGLVGYTLPLNTEKFSAKPLRNLSVKLDLESSRPLKSIYSPTHAVEIRREGAQRATIGYEASEVEPESDFTLYFAPEKDELGLNLLTQRGSGEEGYFLLLASPGVDVKEAQVLPKDVVFVLDTSGSMAGRKLEQAKKALQFCVDSLKEKDRFELIRFSTEVEPLFSKLVAADRPNRARAEEFVHGLRAMGGTAIDDALRQALQVQARPDPESKPATGRPFVVVFLTDGCPTVGTTDEDQIVADVKQESAGHTRIFCFGIGTDVNTHLLDRITEQTHAASQYVLPQEDLELKVSSFFAKIREPVLANPTLKFTGDIRVSKLYPSPLPDLFKGEQLVLVGRYSGHGDSALVLEGTVNGKTRRFTYEASFPEASTGNEFIPRLWATRRVGYLLDEIRLHGESAELRDEVTDLARRYGIVTPYTAYLIVEDERRRDVPVPMRSLHGLDRDSGAREAASQAWGSFKDERSGASAVGGARLGLALKSADAAAPAAATTALESSRALGLPEPGLRSGTQPPDSGKARLLQYAQQTRFVAGKNFFQNEGQWIDSAVQSHPHAKRVRIQFGSPEYFNLVAQEPQALPWLALGRQVQFVLENTVYQIYE